MKRKVSDNIIENMGKDIEIFKNKEFGEIRVTEINNEPYFCVADVCKILNLRVDGVMPRLSKDGVNQIVVIDTLGREQKANFVSEKNLYRIIMRSDKEEAIAFQNWICDDVLPSIRKTGSYSVKPMSLAEIVAANAQAIVEQEKKNRELESKIGMVEEKINAITEERDENGKKLLSLKLSDEKVPEPTLRAQVNQLARSFAKAKNIAVQDVWHKIYERLYYCYHISIKMLQEGKGAKLPRHSRARQLP